MALTVLGLLAAYLIGAIPIGFLVNAVQPDAIRLAPPLILSSAEAASFTAALPAILDAASSAAGREA